MKNLILCESKVVKEYLKKRVMSKLNKEKQGDFSKMLARYS